MRQTLNRRDVLAGSAGAIGTLALSVQATAAQTPSLSVPLRGQMVQNHILTTEQPPVLSDLPYLDMAGNKYWTGDNLGQPTLYVLWASNCGVCLSHELPMLVDLKPKAEALGYRVLPIAMRYDEFPAMERALRGSVGDLNLGLYKMADSRMFNEISPDVGMPRGTPGSAIVDRSGQLRVISLGRAFYNTPEGLEALSWVADT